MKSAMIRWMLGMTLAVGLPLSAVFAAEEMKALPTLLIKGEVVSVDANDPSAVLLKVKDRYGFETPIYLSSQTKITKDDAAVAATNLTAGTAGEGGYNFDINTAKRHAVSVKVSAASAPAAPAAPAMPAMPVAPTVPAVAPTESSPTSQAPTQSMAPAAAPAASVPAAPVQGSATPVKKP